MVYFPVKHPCLYNKEFYFKVFVLKILVYYVRLWLKLMPYIKERKLARKLFDALHFYAVMVKYTPLERSSLSSLNCQPVVFFPFTHHQSSYRHGLWYHYYIMHIFPLYHCMHQKKDEFTHSCVLFLLFSFHNIITNHFSA